MALRNGVLASRCLFYLPARLLLVGPLLVGGLAASQPTRCKLWVLLLQVADTIPFGCSKGWLAIPWLWSLLHPHACWCTEGHADVK